MTLHWQIRMMEAGSSTRTHLKHAPRDASQILEHLYMLILHRLIRSAMSQYHMDQCGVLHLDDLSLNKC